jgi:NADH:ubiquinone oxidoreductase subunit E
MRYIADNHKKMENKVNQSHLFCLGYCEDGKVKKKVMVNNSHFSGDIVEMIRSG